MSEAMPRGAQEYDDYAASFDEVIKSLKSARGIIGSLHDMMVPQMDELAFQAVKAMQQRAEYAERELRRINTESGGTAVSETPRTDAVCIPGLDLADAHDIVDLCRTLERELQQAQQDARRYRWLRDHSDDRSATPFIALFTGSFSKWTGKQADELIDRAMALDVRPV